MNWNTARLRSEPGETMKVLKFLNEKIEYIGMSIMFVIMFVVVLLGIITRLIGRPISWTEEASRLAFV